MLHKTHVLIKFDRALIEHRRSLFLLEQLGLFGVQTRDGDMLTSMLNTHATFFEQDIVKALTLKIVFGKRWAQGQVNVSGLD